MRIFITGATGFIGTQVVRRLADGPYKLRCLVRKAGSPELRKANAEEIVGSITDEAALRAGLQGSDCLINLVAVYSFWVPDKRVYRQVNVEGTRLLMQLALETHIRKVVHVSSVAVFGKPTQGTFDESTPVGPTRFSQYARTKHEGDLIAWKMYEEQRLPLVVVYPAAVLGANDPKATGEFIQRLIAREYPATMFDEMVFPWVYVRDVAEIIVRALEKEDNLGEKYLAVGENLSFGEVNRMVSEFSGVALPRFQLPSPLAFVTAAFLTAVANLTKRPPLWGLSLDQLRVMRNGVKADGSKATRELGVTYTPIKEAVREAVESILHPGSR
jgi:dihydroflavonol-4-reductase